MSYSNLPAAKKRILWAKTAGRCEYQGCNKLLYQDETTSTELNIGWHAHVIGDSPNGPRGDKVKSDELGSDISNIMLLCDAHHRLIDKEKVDEHPPQLLYQMKREHEDRIKKQTSVIEDKQSHIIIYEAEIGEQHPSVDSNKCLLAIQKQGRYLADMYPIKLSSDKSIYKDHEEDFWTHHRKSLNRFFEQEIKNKDHIKHKSVFALAPQPLLIELGHLLYDLKDIQIYQKHREPDTWEWFDNTEAIEFIINKPQITVLNNVALNLSLSGNIENNVIKNTLGENTDIWTITINNPNVYFMKSKKLLHEFVKIYRNLLNEIKSTYEELNPINIFPAVSNSVAIEVGRNRMPKVDLPFIIYDRNNQNGGFVKTIEIK